MKMTRSHKMMTAMGVGAATIAGGAAQNAEAAETFREGLNGYAGTQDTWFSGRATGGELNGFPEGTFVRTAKWGGADQQGLIRFDSIFNDDGGPIALGATINSATLTLTVPTDITYANGEAHAVHQMLLDWAETDAFAAAQWNDGEGAADPAIQTDGTEAAAAAAADNTSYAVANVIPAGAVMTYDVTSIVQNWSNGDGNYGFLLQSLGLSAGNGLFVASSEYAGADGEAARPTLEIDFVPEPASLVLLGMGGLMLLRRRRAA